MTDPVMQGEMGRVLTLLEARFASLEASLERGFSGVTHRQDIANGRTLTLEHTTARLETQVEGLKADTRELIVDLETLETSGCALRAAHTTEIAALQTAQGLTQSQKAMIVGGAGVSGLAVLYAVIELGKGIVELLR